jgi:hypothetical protein
MVRVASSFRRPLAPLALAACVASALVAGGCRSSLGPRDAAGTSVQLGESLHGRVHCQNGEGQCFTIEGVESSLLSFTLASDNGSMGAPVPALSDPEGRPVDLTAYVASPYGAATMQVKGLPLRKTGIYRMTVANQVPGYPVFYRFRYDLAFPPIEDLRLSLQPHEPSPIYVAAPRGGQVIVRVRPLDPRTLPELHAVQDPWGGRALDPTQLPQGAALPQATRLQDGTMILSFTAPRPGVYTVMAATRSCGGDASVSSAVTSPAACTRVWHTNAPCTGYGLPGETSATLVPAPCAPPPPLPEPCAPPIAVR